MATARNLSKFSTSELAAFFKSFDTVLCDCDGVLWLNNTTISGTPGVLAALKRMGKRVFFVTNNSTKSRLEFAEKCERLGFSATIDSILSTAYLTAFYLHDRKFKKKVYIIGTSGIAKELDVLGIAHTGVGPDPLTTNIENLVQNVQLKRDIGAVVVGFDPHFSFPKMMKAASYLSDPTCIFIATNTDERFPMKSYNGQSLVVPGTGCFVKAVEACAEREAIKMGKPSLHIRTVLLKQFNVAPSRTLMIGDRGNTDILLGARCGFQTLLVLSGVTTFDDVTRWKLSSDWSLRDLVPDYYLESLGDLNVPLS